MRQMKVGDDRCSIDAFGYLTFNIISNTDLVKKHDIIPLSEFCVKRSIAAPGKTIKNS
jgi:hypothetical protein